MSELGANAINILHLIDTWGPGGAETVCVELAAGLDSNQFVPTSAVIREGWVYDALRARNLRPSILRMNRLPLDLGYIGRLAALIRQRQIGLIQCHLLTASLYGSVLGRLMGVPVVCTFHGTVDVSTKALSGRVKLRVIALAARRIVFVSESLRRELLKHVRVAPAATSVIHNGVDTDRFTPMPSPALRKQLGVPPDALLVGLVGNVRPAKGYETLLRIAAAAPPDRPMLFVIAGKDNSPEAAVLRAQVAAAGLEHRIRLLGFQDDVPAFLNGVDVFLSTSYTEGFSLTTVQAMACGVPVIATRSGGPEEIITPDVDGMLCDVDDADAIVARLVALSENPALRATIAAAGRATAVRKFGLQRMVQAYVDLYREVTA